MFTGQLDIRFLPNGDRLLLTDMTWAETYGHLDTRVFTAWEGLLHDGNSTPNLLSFLATPPMELPSAFHDAMYQKQAWDNGDEMSRWEADREMRKIAVVTQERARRGCRPLVMEFFVLWHCVQRWITWSGVRLGGWVPWNRHKALASS